MPNYVVLTKQKDMKLNRGPVNFITAPSEAEAAAIALARVNDPSATYRVLRVAQSKDFTITQTRTYAVDDGAGTVVQKTGAEVDALKQADTGF